MSGLGDGKSSKACVSLMSLPLPWEQVALWINQIRMIRGLKKRVGEEEQGRLGLHLASTNDKLLDLGAEDFRLLGSWAPLSSIALYCCCFQSSGSLIIGNKGVTVLIP